MSKYYVGLSATLHDPSLVLLDARGTTLFAEATERYLQNKRAFNAPPDDLVRLPGLLRDYCSESASELVAAVSWSGPFLRRLEVVASTMVAQPTCSVPTTDLSWPGLDAAAMSLALRNSLSQASLNLAASWRTPGPVEVRRYDHHLTHAATAAFTSPFERCVVAVVDGYGEDGSTACYRFDDGELTRLDSPSLRARPVPCSLGHFYGLVCAGCGFDPWLGEEWKVMGLAGYGRFDAALYDLLRPMITVEGLSLGSGCSTGEFTERVAILRDLGQRSAGRHEDAANLAHTGQHVFEEVMTELLTNLRAQHPSPALALCGGCALNSSFNGKIVARTGFDYLHVPSAPADDGNALGAAYLAWAEDQGTSLERATTASPYLGSPISDEGLCRLRDYSGLRHERPGASMAAVVAQALADGLIVGWMQGRAEFGPRALGNRSILADPRSADMRSRINDRVKFREAFRPLAPSILDEHGTQWFEDYQPSPYMERTLRFRPEMAARVPAVVHVDGTGRVHSVRREWNERFHALVSAFHALTRVPVVLNTSFNVMGKPIVHSVEDAAAVFLTSGLDLLVIGDDVWWK
jgi:carbamoyltransferase